MGAFKILLTWKIHAVSMENHPPSNEKASNSKFQTTHQHKLLAYMIAGNKLAKKFPKLHCFKVTSTYGYKLL
jgi:hypothetical protein